MTQRAASCVWGLGQEKGVQQVQPDVQAAIALGSHDSADPVVLEVSLADRDVVWNL